MKTYIRTEIVLASPAYEGEDGVTYPKERELPDGIDKAYLEEGYNVIKEDNSIMWSPKDVFEKAYNVADTFKDRLTIECKELEEKLIKLNDFNASEKINVIDPVQKSLLVIQASAMRTYLECLKKRLTEM